MHLMRKMLVVAASLPALMVAAPVAAQASVPGPAVSHAVNQAPDVVTPAIGLVPCSGQKTEPIEFFQTTGPTTTCFGGTVGARGTNFQAFTMHAGGYYGHFTYMQGNKVIIQKFRKGNLIAFGPAHVIGVSITPPF